tara:strand:+ start:155253 stop:156572 length:1320 start_codon:yes stop_codon:yes gene_type:complete
MSSNKIVHSATVRLWGTRIGALAWDERNDVAVFRYDPRFQKSGIQVAPLIMPLRDEPYVFDNISKRTFSGLNGMVIDSLPDTYGNKIINQWLAKNGRKPDSLNPVEKLCYIGQRGMGALEFDPSSRALETSEAFDVADLAQFANDIVNEREAFQTTLAADQHDNLSDAIRVGTSGAGGARAKALIAWHKERNEVRSGQVKAPEGFGYYLIKFDGISNNKDRDGVDPNDMTVVEYIYSLLCAEAGINMAHCELLDDGSARHFVTERFDRDERGNKVHFVSWCGLAHIDRDDVAAYSYEQLIMSMRELRLPQVDIEQQFRRTVFNHFAVNFDDHSKNFGFLMNKRGQWSLSPAYDMTFSYDPSGRWTKSHQLTLNGKSAGHTLDDIHAFAQYCNVPKRRAETIIDEVRNAVAKFGDLAKEHKLDPVLADHIITCHKQFEPK